MSQIDNHLEICAPQALWEKVGQSDVVALVHSGIAQVNALLKQHPGEITMEVVAHLYQQWEGPTQTRAIEFNDTLYCQIVVGGHEYSVAAGVLAGMYLALGVEHAQR